MLTWMLQGHSWWLLIEQTLTQTPHWTSDSTSTVISENWVSKNECHTANMLTERQPALSLYTSPTISLLLVYQHPIHLLLGEGVFIPYPTLSLAAENMQAHPSPNGESRRKLFSQRWIWANGLVPGFGLLTSGSNKVIWAMSCIMWPSSWKEDWWWRAGLDQATRDVRQRKQSKN